MVGLFEFASMWDVSERPIHRGDFYETGPDRRDYLASEGDTRWNLHILGQFEVAAESLEVGRVS